MKLRYLALLLLLPSCDQIQSVTDKVGDLKDLKDKVSGLSGDDEKAVRELKEDEFSEFISEKGKLHVVDFYADWCGPCKKLSPVLAAAVKETGGKARLGKVDVEKATELSGKLEVSSIPDVRFYLDGKMVHRFVGNIPKSEIEDLLKTHTKGLPEPEKKKKKSEKEKSADPADPNAPQEPIQPMPEDWMPPGITRE